MHPLCHTPLRGSDYHRTGHGSAQPLVSVTVGPAHKQPTVKEWPLAGHSVNCQWNGGRWVKNEVRGRFRPSPTPPPHSSPPDLGPVGELGGSRNKLGAVSCMAPESSPGPPTGWIEALRRWRTSPPSLSLWLGRNASLPGLQSVGPTYPLPTHLPCHLGWPKKPEGPVGSWAPGSLSYDSWTVSGDLSLRELPTEICLLFSRTGNSERESCALGPCSFLSENNVCLGEIYRNMVTWPWPDLKNKGSDTKKFATTNHVPPSPFLVKGFPESFWNLGFLRSPVSLHVPQ